MALAIGNKTNSLKSGSGQSSDTVGHTQDTGANGYLMVMLAVSNSTSNPTGVTYNGVPMTQLSRFTTSVTTDDWSIWGLAAPATGANNLVVTYALPLYNPISIEIISFTGCGGAGVTGYTDTSGPPASVNLTVLANSVIVASGIAGSATSASITINGSSRTIDWTNNIYNWCFGGVSALGLPAGSITCTASSTAQIAVHAVELKEFGAAPASRRIFNVT